METISIPELHQHYSNQVGTIIDLRSNEAYDQSHIPGAINIPHNQLKSRIAELPAQRPLYLICEKGGRSIGASVILKIAAIEAICVSPGGMNTWIEMGLETQKQ